VRVGNGEWDGSEEEFPSTLHNFCHIPEVGEVREIWKLWVGEGK
jgi:hypothetical protein